MKSLKYFPSLILILIPWSQQSASPLDELNINVNVEDTPTGKESINVINQNESNMPNLNKEPLISEEGLLAGQKERPVERQGEESINVITQSELNMPNINREPIGEQEGPDMGQNEGLMKGKGEVLTGVPEYGSKNGQDVNDVPTAEIPIGVPEGEPIGKHPPPNRRVIGDDYGGYGYGEAYGYGEGHGFGWGHHGCFPGTSMVMLGGGRKKSMEELRIGDAIMTVENGNLVPTRVLGFIDKKVNQTADYINLILEDNRSLFISSRHTMFIKGENSIIQSILAKDVSIGDTVIVSDGKKVGFVHVKDITVELKSGAYVPMTHVGTLLVDGVLVSSYTNFDHRLAHIGLFPLRWWPTLLLDNEISQHLEGVRTFPRLMRDLASLLGLGTRVEKKMETMESPVLGMSQLAMEKMDKTEF